MRVCPNPGVVTALVCALLLGGCAELPRVEDRLQRMQFHPNIYIVQAGDTLELVAFRYGLARDELVALNPSARSGVRPGMALNVLPGTQMPGAMAASGGAGQSVSVGLAPQPSLAPQATAQITPEPVQVSPTRRVAPIARAPLQDDISQHSDPEEPITWSGEHPAEPREEVVGRSSDFQPITGYAGSSDDARPSAQDGASAGPLAKAAPIDQSARWVWPTRGEVARGFSPDRVNGTGVDIAGVPGQPVLAASDGQVVYSGRSLDGAGNLVIVQHPDGLMSTYGYTDRLYVAEDDRVRAGDPIASLGVNTERESVLHFEVRRDGNPLNPLDFLPKP